MAGITVPRIMMMLFVLAAANVPSEELLYNEPYRPQFHFSPKKNWTNDPNGLVYYQGEFHLFFQHNPFGINWGNMHWGHAVSPDLVHWTELPIAIAPDNLGTIFSGSAVVDWNNTSGLQTGTEPVLCAFYTAAGKPFVQCMAYSTDRGRTWIKYAKNPIVDHIAGENRDPKVIWHEPSRKWVMALYLKDNDFAFLGSKNLIEWSPLSTITVAGSIECPDLFELAVDGDWGNSRWIFLGGHGNYLIGRFTGETFLDESGKIEADYGKNFYATQTYSDIPKSDGRRIQIAWMNGGQYPGMPFNQQMTFPCELTLRTLPEGLRVCRNPVKEIELLHRKSHVWRDRKVEPGEHLLEGIEGGLFEIRAEAELGGAPAWGLIIRGAPVRVGVDKKEITALGARAPLIGPARPVVQLRVLADRASLEVFANGGAVSMSSCFLPPPPDTSIKVFAENAPVTFKSLEVYELDSSWR